MNVNLTIATISFILASVVSSSVAQVTLKIGMSKPAVQTALANGHQALLASSIVFNPHVLIGLTLYFLAAVFWLYVLAKLDVSVAYPFVGLGFIFTMILARFVNGDPVTITKLIGTLLISIGVYLISRQQPSP